MKSYTDIEQSRKLAEILPIETADMYYFDNIPYCKYTEEDRDYWYVSHDYILAWSLAALLNVLPKIHKLKPILDLEENSIQYSGIDLYVVADNPVDACVAMIERLHELKNVDNNNN